MDVAMIEAVLIERQKTHGDFSRVATLASAVESLMLDPQICGQLLRVEHAVALRMIFLKLARIVCGNPDHADSWLDVAGYAMLAAKCISDHSEG